MIIKLSPAEVKNFVAVALDISGALFDLEIVTIETPVLVALRTALTENPRFATCQKISAIKRFRDLAGRATDRYGYSSSVVGLADAKWAVENPTTALANLEQTGGLR